MISYDSIAWYCMLLRCWLRRAGCVSQDAYTSFDHVCVETEVKFKFFWVSNTLYPIFQLTHSAMVDCNPTSMTLTVFSLLRSFHHIQNSPFELIALASDDTPGYVSKLQQVTHLKQIWPPISKILFLHFVHNNLTDFRISVSSLTHLIWERWFFWRRRIEDLPNSAIFKLSCRSKHFGFFGKGWLKDTKLKCLWPNF